MYIEHSSHSIQKAPLPTDSSESNSCPILTFSVQISKRRLRGQSVLLQAHRVECAIVSAFREWATLRSLRSSTRQTMLTVGSSTVQGFSVRQKLCIAIPASTRLLESTQRSRPGEDRAEINLFADLTAVRLVTLAHAQIDVPTWSRIRTEISREFCGTTGRRDTLAQVQDNISPKLRAEIHRHTFGAAVRLDTVAQVQIDVRPDPPPPSSRLLDSSEHSGRELSVDPVVVTLCFLSDFRVPATRSCCQRERTRSKSNL